MPGHDPAKDPIFPRSLSNENARKMTARPLAELTTVVTCFAFREEYFPELSGMIATIEECHPEWPMVIGRGTPRDDGVVTFDVETPDGPERWTFPVPFHLCGGEDDWRRITRMKAWWLHEVWLRCGGPTRSARHRIVWIDADARCRAPLAFEVDPQSEIIAGPWWRYPELSDYEGITTGLLLFQGSERGPVAGVPERWSDVCLEQIRNLGPPTVPWPEGDQEVLTKVLLAECPEMDATLRLLKLDHDTYCAFPPTPEAVIDHWMMSGKMARRGSKGSDWPPPEHLRRRPRN